MSAGYRHTAAVTEDGELFTWGEGDYGRLGHGDSNCRNVPTLVKDVTNVGQVACGSAYTLAVSLDSRTVWSFGSADNGEFFYAFLLYWHYLVFTLIHWYMSHIMCTGKMLSQGAAEICLIMSINDC